MLDWRGESVQRRGAGGNPLADRLEAELVRGRRQGHGLALVVLDDSARRRRIGWVDRTPLVQDLVRRYDWVLPQGQGGRLVVLAPQTEPSAARALADRLAEATKLPVGVACAPDDGEILSGLLECAVARAGARRAIGRR